MFCDMEEIRQSCEERRVLQSTVGCVYPLRYGRDSTVCVRKEDILQYFVFIPLDMEEILQYVVFTPLDMEEIRQSVCVK
jgi:hypothetical protein